MSDQVLSQWWKRLSSLSSQDTSSTDLVLVSDDGERVVCHQLIMGLASPILSSLLQEHKGEEVVINLPEVEGRIMRSLLGVVYNRYLPTSLEDQQDIDKLAQMLGLRVRHSKSNIVFKCEGGEIEEENYYEPYLEEQTTFLYVDEVKTDDMLTLDESETYEVNVTEDNKLEIPDLQSVKRIDLSENQIALHDQDDSVIKDACSFNVNDLVTDKELFIEDEDEKILIVPIDSHEEIIHETVEIENTVEKKPRKSNARKSQIRQFQSQPCKSCNQPTINHKFKDLVTSEWFYHCCFCNKTNMKSAAAFVKHVSTHVTSKCQLCQKSKSMHKENKHFFCCQCKKKVLGSKLSLHVQKHVSKEQIICGVCHEEFANVYSLKDHVRKEHENPLSKGIPPRIDEVNLPTSTISGTPRLNCPSCSKSMTRRHYTKHHKASCSKERVLKCDVCGREGFCNSSTLQDHIRAKHTHEKPFKCEYCNKAFPAASHLAHHRMKKHRVNSKGELQPKMVFPCNFCGKVLTTKPKLLAHVKVIHQGIKDFACLSCKKSFSSKSNLDIHIGSVHTGNLPYKCEFCSKSFARKNLLSAHRQTAHQFIEAQSVHTQGAL